MTIKATLGNVAVALGGAVGTKAAVLTNSPHVAAATPIGYAAQFHEPYSIVGLMVPNWLGLALYVAFLVLGTIFGSNQKTAVDDKFTRPWLKPIYSLVFGAAMTLFVMPIFYPAITIWGLIFPALFFAAIGAVAIYMIIAFFTSEKLWDIFTNWGYVSITEYLTGLPARIKAAAQAFLGGK